MPTLPIIQMSPPGVDKLPGVDHVVYMDGDDRFPQVLFRSYTCMHEYAKTILMLHSDVVVLRDLRHLFDGDFDVALPVRPPHDRFPANPEVIYQSGIVAVSKSPHFWIDWYFSTCVDIVDWRRGKFDIAFHKWLAQTIYKVKGLEGVIFTPDGHSKAKDWQGAGALHYEAGFRKPWMLKQWGAHGA